nr:beta-ketoacyl synthase N-terminal-like domain-containing protein [Dissulfurirhabdus thermomarina]
MGAVSPFGPGVGPLAEALREGRTGLRDLAAFGAEWGGFLGGAVDLEAVKGRVPPARRRHLNRMGLFLEAAVDEALASAGIEPRGLGPVPLVYGSAFGCAGNVHGFFTTLLAEGPRAASPQDFKLSVTNAPAALAAQRLGIHGPVWVFSADEASWEAALHWGCDLVRRGGARRVVVAAAEELGDAILAIHRALGFVAPGPGPGYRLGEGAVAAVVEAEAAARERGARVLGRVAGWAAARDAACGPQEFPADPAVVETLCRGLFGAEATGLSGRGVLLVPGGGHPAAEGILDRAAARLAAELPGWEVLRPRAPFGESGAAGGLGLTALLAGERPGGALVLTAARGGTLAATLVAPGRGHA